MIHLHADVIHGLLLLGIVGVLADRWLYGRRTDSLADACKKHGVEWVEPEPVRTLLLRGGRSCWEWMSRPESDRPAYYDDDPPTDDFAKALIEEALEGKRPVPFPRVATVEREMGGRAFTFRDTSSGSS